VADVLRAAPPQLVGRAAEIERLTASLERLPVAVVYGVPGVGKTAVAQAVGAAWRKSGRPIWYRKSRGEPIATIVADLRREIAGGAAAEEPDEESRLVDLARQLDAREGLLVLDDLDSVEAEPMLGALASFATRLERGRVLGASRARLPVRAGDPDRFELRLEGLDAEAARELWRSLDELYGAVGGFEAAMARARGNPFLLRRAHAGGLDDDDPVDGAIAAFAADERLVAGALALGERRLPLEALALLFDDADGLGRARAALRGLTRRLVADVDGAGRAGLHDLFREGMAQRLDGAERSALHGKLAGVVTAADLDPADRLRELTRHLCAAGRWEEASEALVVAGPELVRIGATGELLRCIERIPAEKRDADLRLVQARCHVRLLDLRRGLDELEHLMRSGAEPRDEIAYSWATTAYSLGRPDLGIDALATVAGRTTGAMRRLVLTQWAWGLTSAGRVDEGVGLLADEENRAAEPQDAALFAFYRAGALWAAERDVEMAAALERARTLGTDQTLPYASSEMAPILLAAMTARLGRSDEALEWLTESEMQRSEDTNSVTNARRMRGCVYYELGRRMEALDLFEAARVTYRRASNIVTVLVTQVWIGRLYLLLGRRAAGLQLLAETEEEARQHGLHGSAMASERARSLDPLAQIGEALSSEPPLRPSEAVRWRALAALRAAAAGRAEEAAALQRENAAFVDRPGFALERAVDRLAWAVSQRLAGKESEARAAVAVAEAEAVREGVDAGLVQSLHAAVAGALVVTRTGRASLPPGALGAPAVVVDAKSHELRHRGGTISLRRRPVLRRLLYAMAARPNQPLGKEALAASLWPARYNPLRHDNALWVNVRRLRQLIAPSGLTVELADEGYVLEAPEGFAFIGA
jgi:tetratricopeptide (TPR) repeat protein